MIFDGISAPIDYGMCQSRVCDVIQINVNLQYNSASHAREALQLRVVVIKQESRQGDDFFMWMHSQSEEKSGRECRREYKGIEENIVGIDRDR